MRRTVRSPMSMLPRMPPRIGGVTPRALQVNGDVAPVCPISKPQTPPAQPGITVPFVPRAIDLPSALQAINALTTVVNATATYRWLEKERVTQLVRVTNPDDEDQWVDVLRIVKLVMQDQITGELWVWELEPVDVSTFND